MKDLYIVFAILILVNWSLKSQETIDMENCDSSGGLIDLRSAGDDFPCDCFGNITCYIECSTAYSYSGNYSGLISNSSNTMSFFRAGKICDEWGLEFWMYVPSGKDAFFNIQSDAIICPDISAVGDVYFNKDLENDGIGIIEDSTIGDVTFNFPHDQWFNVIINVDLSFGISLATWELKVDCEEVIPLETPFTDINGIPPTNYGGLFFSSKTEYSEFYIDDYYFILGYMPCILSIEDDDNIDVNIYPNPSNNHINIETQDLVKNVAIYNLQGVRVKETTKINAIDVSNLSAGLYFVEVSTEKGRSVQKLIKN